MKMGGFLGIDTSNYTTSVAVYNSSSKSIVQKKLPLPVKEGELGLRQSDAVFHHTRHLPEIFEELFLNGIRIDAVAASDRPTEAEGSYMPCFLSGLGAARQLAAAMRLPLMRFSHQQGHVAAAAYGAGRLDLLDGEFIAFHVSGGTTDGLIVTPDDHTIISCERVAGSLDLKAGQLVDRVGLMLGLKFPAGSELEKLALKSTGGYGPKPALKAGWCSLSGIENQCRSLYEKGADSAEIAHFCISGILAAVDGMTSFLIEQYPNRPIVYSGGVMSNSIIRKVIEDKYGGFFAPPEYSSDNAVGIALLAALKSERRDFCAGNHDKPA